MKLDKALLSLPSVREAKLEIPKLGKLKTLGAKFSFARWRKIPVLHLLHVLKSKTRLNTKNISLSSQIYSSVENLTTYMINDIILPDFQRILLVVEWDADHVNLIPKDPNFSKKSSSKPKRLKNCVADISSCFWDHHFNDNPLPPPSTSTTLEVSLTKDDPDDLSFHHDDPPSPQDVHNSLKLCDS